MAMGPANPTPNARVTVWLATKHLPPCPPAAAAKGPPPRPSPAQIALHYWRTIPLPVPHPAVPPGYAVTGKTAYLVTGGTVDPGEYRFATPLGPLTITATGYYLVDWGDGTSPTWTGPYPENGVAWPDGMITHVYDQVASVTLAVHEVWRATWTLAGDRGTLTGLATNGAIAGLPVRQIQAVITSG